MDKRERERENGFQEVSERIPKGFVPKDKGNCPGSSQWVAQNHVSCHHLPVRCFSTVLSNPGSPPLYYWGMGKTTEAKI